jgi:mannose-6-phosphate isomerase-like protein (cupin superfamily)
VSHPALYYPPSRYHRDVGEVSATLRRTGHEPEVRYPNGVACHYLATHASTVGQFGLYRWEMPGSAGGPGPHFHRAISESFYVLAGSIGLYDGRGWVEAGPGDYLFVPEGGIHGFRNGSDEPASMLILFAPGATREDYFETLARVALGETAMSDEERAAFMLRHDTFWA